MDPRHASALLVGGAVGIDACQVLLLARSVLPAWGEPTPPRRPPGGGNEKGGVQQSTTYLIVLTKVAIVAGVTDI